MTKYLFPVVLLLAIYALTVLYGEADWDLWARLAVGAVVCQSGEVLHEDVFAYTPTKELWVDHEWGAGVVFYFFAHHFGDLGLVLLKLLLLAGTLTFIHRSIRLRASGGTPRPILYYLLVLYGLAYAFDNILRSHSFTYFFFALWIYLLDLVRLGRRRLIWLFPATMLLWANLHGGFVAGLGIVLLHGIGAALARRRLIDDLVILVTSALASLVNPYGFAYWRFLWDAVSMPRPNVPEWAPIDLLGPLAELWVFKLFGVLTLIALAASVLRRKSIDWSDLLILGVTFVLALRHVRHNPFFLIAAACYIYHDLPWHRLVQALAARAPAAVTSVTQNAVRFLIYVGLLAAGTFAIFWVPLKVRVSEDRFPTRAVSFIEQNELRGNLLVPFNWGSYALWKLFPQCRVSIDGRYEEVYPDQVVTAMVQFESGAPNWDEVIRSYPPDLMLLPAVYPAMLQSILNLGGWSLVYRDEVACVLVRKALDKGRWALPEGDLVREQEKYRTRIKL